MNASWKSIAGSLILGAVIAFALGGGYFYYASQYSALAPNESTATAYVYQIYRAGKNHTYDNLRCDYSFSVEGKSYYGHGNCPLPSAGESAKEKLQDLAGVLDNSYTSHTTVYYDPADPTTNSLTEFSVKSERDYLFAKLGIGVGAMLTFLVLIGALIVPSVPSVKMEGVRSGGIVVDAEGTVIYPDEKNPGQQEETHYSYQDVSTEERPDRSAND